jgi:carbon-monoxide dehydrogenase large subunit
MSAIGSRLKRIEDRPLLLGQGRFAADISFPDQLHMRIVRSPVARGRLLGIDAAEAGAMAGVATILTAADVAHIPPIDFRMVRVEGLKPYRQRVLATDTVRYVGEPVAAVLADDPYRAEDAAERVFPEIDELPPLLHATDEPGEFAPGLGTEGAVIVKAYGDLDAAFTRAYATIELELAIGRHSASPLETRGAVARYDEARGLLQLFGAAKVPHTNRLALAALLGLAPGAIHLYEGHVGGGFGVRGEIYPEDVLALFAALKLHRPVKWIEDRREHLIAANQSREQLHRVRAAIDARGFILGLEDEFWHDQGAYVRTHAATVPDLTAAMLPGPYLIPAYRATGHIRLTNKTPAGTYRAPGRYESSFVRERLLDEIGSRLGIGPVEVRRRNLIPEDRMPHDRGIDALGTPVVYDSGRYHRLLVRFLELVRHDELESRLVARRAEGERVGFGFGYFVEKSGLGPFETARVAIDAAGAVEAVTGAASLGQGLETSLAQICADALGAAPEGISVVHGQTDRIAEGRGSYASRATAMAGPAMHLAASALRERVLAIAGRQLQGEAAALEIVGGQVRFRNRPEGASMSLAEIARAHAQSGDPAPLAEERRFESDHMNYPYGIHGAVARIDGDTGGIVIERIFIAYDVGRAVNPLLVEGQLAGGAAQGLGGALFEEFLYDDAGQPLSASFADYLLPTAAEVPPIEMLVTEDAPSPLNPLGVKGAGEGGINAMGAAIAAAIDAAIGRPGAVRRLPVTPPRLRALLAAP